ncbi:EFR1 family ferrodoxin [Fusibacter sp. JL216-2]|uniref:EFR1 family ferrodoxin n=1 Tax=Fusibacter sp. JL216-2 TaxID=3071453 RepID=UPI003D356954
MKIAVFYYFTGSGNTLKAMDAVKKVFEYNNIAVRALKIEESGGLETIEEDILGLFFPVAIQSTFPLVWDFIYELPNVQSKKVFMLDTMEQFSGGIVGPVKKVLKEKGYECIGAMELKMGSSMQVKTTDLEAIEKKNHDALELARQYAENLILGKTHWPRVPILSDLMRGISKDRKIWTTTSKNLEIQHANCIRCGLCIKKCPVNALSLPSNKVVLDHNVCNVCMRCTHICPKDAFLYKTKNVVHFNKTIQ